jgi:hypothetical protein
VAIAPRVHRVGEEIANSFFVGDAMATYAVTTGRSGPQIAPFSADATQARHLR